MAGHFHDRVAAPIANHSPQDAAEFRGLGCRQACVGPLLAIMNLDAADQPAGRPGRGKKMAKDERSRRLPVGTCYSNQPEAGGGPSVDTVGKLGSN